MPRLKIVHRRAKRARAADHAVTRIVRSIYARLGIPSYKIDLRSFDNDIRKGIIDSVNRLRRQ